MVAAAVATGPMVPWQATRLPVPQLPLLGDQAVVGWAVVMTWLRGAAALDEGYSSSGPPCLAAAVVVEDARDYPVSWAASSWCVSKDEQTHEVTGSRCVMEV